MPILADSDRFLMSESTEESASESARIVYRDSYYWSHVYYKRYIGRSLPLFWLMFIAPYIPSSAIQKENRKENFVNNVVEEDGVDVFDGYSFKGRHSVILDEEESLRFRKSRVKRILLPGRRRKGVCYTCH